MSGTGQGRRIAGALGALGALVAAAAAAPLLAAPPAPPALAPAAIEGPAAEARPAEPGAATAPRPRAEAPATPAPPPDAATDWRRLGSPELRARDGSTPRGFSPHRIIHFTFDDGPSEETTPRLLDALADEGVRATFFIVGRSLVGPRSAERRALAQRIEAEGHTVALHTYAHRDLRTLSAEQIGADLDRAEAALEATVGFRPGLFRPPYGGRSATSNALLRDRGYGQVLWNVAPEAPSARSPEAILRSFRAALDRQDRHHLGPGAIVLLHDPNGASVDAFTLLIREVRARNCALLDRPGEELWDVTDDLAPFVLHDGALPEDVVARRQAEARRAALASCPANGDGGSR